MTNTFLNITILKILNRVNVGLREKTLQAEVEIAMDRVDLTTDEFADALIDLANRGLILKEQTLLGSTLWSISELGKEALMEH